MIEAVLSELRQPEYVHVLINPLPIYGLAMGLIGLLLAVCQRSRAATIAALVIVFISAASAWPVKEFGQQAYDRVLSMADNDGRAWLAEHKDRAEDLVWFYYALAVLSAVALIAPSKWPRSSLGLAVAVLVLGAICFGLGGYIGYAGGKIRHREFRTGPPPAEAPKSAAPETSPAAPPAGSVAPPAVQVSIQDLKFSRETIEIKKGETVEWLNNDLTPHTVTSQEAGKFDSGSIEAGDSWRHTFSQPGTFPYICTFHDEMKGTVIVK